MLVIALRKIKSWLNPPRSYKASALHHPSLIDIPALLELRTKAKLIFLASITFSQDPMIQEILTIATDHHFVHSQKIPTASVELLRKVRSSVANTTGKTLNLQCKRTCKEWSSEIHSNKLKELSVQSKALEVVELENSNNVWKRVLQGLPAG